MSSAFQLLSRGGSSFDRRKFKREHEMFAKKTEPSPTSNPSCSSRKINQPQTQALPTELDFFSQSSTRPSPGNGSEASSSVTKKRKREREVPVKQEPDVYSSSSEDDQTQRGTKPSQAPPKQKITLTGPSPLPTSYTSFSSLLPSSQPRAQAIRRNLTRQGIHELWGVQGAVAGGMLSGEGREEGRDLMVVAPTGSGKTLAYLLPLLIKLDRPCRASFNQSQASPRGNESKRPRKDSTLAVEAEAETSNSDLAKQGLRSLIILPTHELALQIQNELLKLVSNAGGSGGSWRCMLLDKATERSVILASPGLAERAEVEGEGGLTSKVLGIDVLVATPERLHHLVSEDRVDLSQTRTLILDEADRLLGPDFYDQLAPIVESCTHPKIQKVLLSATMEAGPEALGRAWLRDEGVRIVVGRKDAATSTISQHLQFCGSESGKLMALRNDIAAGKITPPTLIFVQSIERANDLFRELVLDGLQVGVIHSDRSKTKREETVRDFREGKIWMLVVTELMARGLDFKGVEVVVNYDFPQTVQSYVHRIGRTGRAGRQGVAITYFSLEDGPYLRTIANVLNASNCPVPSWMLDLPAPSKNAKKALKKKPVERKAIGGQKGKNVGRGEALSRRDMVDASRRRAEKGEGLRVGAKGGKKGRGDEGGVGGRVIIEEDSD